MTLLLDWLGAVLVVAGIVFMILAAIGIVRMPDVYMRLQASTKASTLGVGLVFTAVALHIGAVEGVVRSLALIAFIGLTVPVAAHALGLAAHRQGVPVWRHTQFDELRDHEEKNPDGRGTRPE